jgi:predicted transcriptional regulator
MLTLRLDPKLKDQLDRLSKATSRSRSFVAAEAIRGYVALNNWQIEETRKALAEAEHGEFAATKTCSDRLRNGLAVRVRWLRKAIANLDAEAEYIARDSPAAGRVAARVTHAIEGLRHHPSMGRPGRVPGTRELVVPGGPYVVPYRVRNDSVEILRIFHTSRKWPDKL